MNVDHEGCRGRFTRGRHRLGVALFISGVLCGLGQGCRNSSPPPAVAAPDRAAPTEPVAPAVQPVVKIGGWKTLLWGDDWPAIKAKVQEEGLLTCNRPERQKDSKGRKLHIQVCRGTPKEVSGLGHVLLFYLNDGLQRVILNYRMSPHQATVANLEDALTSRYCELSRPLNSALLQSKQGNIGQRSQVQLNCEKSGGSMFIQIENDAEDSEIGIFISSDAYDAYLKENEFTKSF